MNRERFRNFLGRIPLHVVIIGMVLLWLVPAMGIFVTSFLLTFNIGYLCLGKLIL